MRNLRKGSFLRTHMQSAEIWSEINFIAARRAWLAKQPMDSFGKLLREDDRLEAGTMVQRLEELEVEIQAL